MSRNIDRDTQRRLIKLNNWKKNWTIEQKIFYRAEVEKEVDKVQDMTEKVFDSCYISAIGDYADLELEKIIEIAKRASLYMQDVKIFITDKEKGEQYFMKVENEELREEIKKVIRKQMKEGKLKSKALVELKNEFDMPANFLSNLWLEVKSEKSKAYNKHTPTKFKKDIPAAEEEKEKFLKEIGVDTEKILKGEKEPTKGEYIEKELPFVIEEKELEEERTITIEEATKLEVEVAEFKAPTTIKKVSETFKGQYDTYTRGESGVITSQMVFKDINELKEYKSHIESDYAKTKAEINQQIEDLKEELMKIDQKENDQMKRINEVEEVFNA